MLVDWFTVAAQVLNFALLVWLLKHFLYKPILDAIDQREQKVAAVLASAEATRTEARGLRDEVQQREDALDQQRSAQLDKARQDAQAEGERLLAQAQKAADALTTDRQQALLGDARRLNQTLVKRTQHEVLAIARQALGDLADTGLEAAMAAVLVQRLQALDGPAAEQMARALTASPGTDVVTALVRSAFELPAASRAALQTAVAQRFGAELQLRFETAPALVAGIELSANGQKLAWSIDDYLGGLQRGVDELLQPAKAASPPTATAAAAATTDAPDAPDAADPAAPAPAPAAAAPAVPRSTSPPPPGPATSR